MQWLQTLSEAFVPKKKKKNYQNSNPLHAIYLTLFKNVIARGIKKKAKKS